jgi:hypothetical protein
MIMKPYLTLPAILAGALVAPVALAQPHVDVHAHITAPPVGEHGRRDWKIDHPVVTSYSTLRGEPGSKVVIHGQHFDKSMAVVWGGNPITGATVSDTEITFTVPKGAANGGLALRGGGLAHDLAIGDFEVAKVDKAEWKKHEDAQKAEAQAAWDARAKTIAKDKAARDAALAQQEADLEKTRSERRQHELDEERKSFDRAFLADPATVAELALHADHEARLERIQRLAADQNDAKLGVRVEVDTKRETERHDQRMAALKAAFKGG